MTQHLAIAEAQRRWGNNAIAMEAGGRAAVGSGKIGEALFIGKNFRQAFKKADTKEKRDA